MNFSQFIFIYNYALLGRKKSYSFIMKNKTKMYGILESIHNFVHISLLNSSIQIFQSMTHVFEPPVTSFIL